MFSILKYLIKSNLGNSIPGNRPLVVFESDDWGSIRMNSAGIYQQLLSECPEKVNDPYLKYDALESNDDLELLFELLTRHKDSENNHPVITANCVGGNPDFSKIRQLKFHEFIWQDFRDTLKEYPKSEKVFELELEGLRNGIFIPQFHAKQHIQVERWMSALKSGNVDLLKAFDLGLISLSNSGQNTCISYYMDAFNANSKDDLNQIISDTKDGLGLFEKVWGYKSKTVIAPCYYWHPRMEKELVNDGVKAFQGLRVQKISQLNHKPYDFKKQYHYNGEKNSYNQYYFVRNCFFEPSLDPIKFGADACMKQVENALNKSGVAIISAHRLNFIGSIDPTNRERSLKELDRLLSFIEHKFPMVKYLSTADLLELYLQN